MPINDRLKELLSVNQNKRLAEEKARENRRDNPKILRHTTYQGDRKIQQLGDEIIENGVVLNNQAVEIGQFSGSGVPTIPTGGGGGIGNGGGDGKLPTKSPAPSGCEQPPPQCVWSPDPSPPLGWQSYGSVTLESGTLNLYCLAGTSVPSDLNCEFLRRYSCSGGVCQINPLGIYSSKADCEAALIASFDFDVNVTSAFNGSISFFPSLYTTTGLASDTFFFRFVADPTCDGVLFPASRRKDLIRVSEGVETTEVAKFISIV